MSIFLMLITLGIIYWRSDTNWIFWSILGLGIFVWLCGQAVLNSRQDLLAGRVANERVYKFWFLTYGTLFWIYLLACLLAIVYVFVAEYIAIPKLFEY